MSRIVTLNFIVFVIFLCIPLAAEFVTATPKNVPGTGFAVLLYEPFQFAYALLATIVFISVNVYINKRQNRNMILSVFFGLVLTVAWFLVAFLAVAQLHIHLGGKL